MKIKVTAREVKECFIDVYNISYCGIQYIESYLQQVMYTCGIYGWNSDIYDCMNGCAISTGYRPCGNKYIDRDIYTKYNNRFNRLKHKTSVKAIEYLQAIIKEQKQRESEKEFNALCRKIEETINNTYAYQWHKDNLSEYHQSFFPSYDETDYMTVYYDGYYISSDIESIIVASTQNIEEIEVNLDNLSDDIFKCSSEQLKKLETNYNIKLSSNIVSYIPVNGFYAVIRNKDFNADIFNCGALPYDVQEV